MKKIEQVKEMVKENREVFRCPLCAENMDLQANSLVCSYGHCFDFSRKGYVNFTTGPVKRLYNRELFLARNQLFKSGFFDPVIEKLVKLITEEQGYSISGTLKILDAGCGEGSLLARVLNWLKENSAVSGQGFGIDISREGIKLASRDFPGVFWSVADLAWLPFKDNSFHIILNVLSPSNYKEFSRTVMEGGTLIKLVPGNKHLKELREFIYQGDERENYSHEEVVNHFRANFNVMDMYPVCYYRAISQDNLQQLVKMTPLSWGVPQTRINQILKYNIQGATFDLKVIRGKKRAF